MGKAYKWFRGLLGLKKSDPSSKEQPLKKKWSFPKSHKEKNFQISQKIPVSNDNDRNNDAAGIPPAAPVVTENSDVVVKVNGGGGGSASAVAYVSESGAGYGSREECAAVTIQAHFRAYLSRRALRALKALVKLQALTRGHLVRKQTADILRRMQALLRVQARARAVRSLISESPHSSKKSSNFYPGPATPEKFEPVIRTRNMKHEQLVILKRNGSKSNGCIAIDQEKLCMNRQQMGNKMGEKLWKQGPSSRNVLVDDERTDKILDVHVGKPCVNTKQRSTFHTSHLSVGSDKNCHSFSTSKDSTAHQAVLSPTSPKVQSLCPLGLPENVDESAFCTAENSPQVYSASSMGGSLKRDSFTPSKSDGSRSCLSGFSDHPNYMAYTESSKAKARSHSAPKQRPQYERSNSSKRYSVHGYNDSRSNSQKVSSLHATFANRAYPGSGRLDRLGMPIRGDVVSFSGSHWHRY